MSQEWTAAVQQLQERALAAGRVLLTGPIDPDGDSIGAAVALGMLLRQLGVPEVVVAGRPGFRYGWLPGAAEMVPDADVTGPFGLAVVLDGDRRRLEKPIERLFDATPVQAIVDHHKSTRPDDYHLALLDHQAESTCTMVHRMMLQWGLSLTPELAALLYTGLIFDTGGFRHSNTRPETLQLGAELIRTGIDHASIFTRVLVERRPQGVALLGRVLAAAEVASEGRVYIGSVPLVLVQELGAESGDNEGIVDALLYTRGVDLACLFVEKEPGRIKLSLRSRSELDVAELARSLNPHGGGHPRAAGAVVLGSLQEVKDRVRPALVAAVERLGRGA